MGAPTSETDDPLLSLLQRYEVELAAFIDAPDSPEQDWDQLAQTTWSRTQDEILERKPETTTAEGALFALDHVLKSEWFEDRAEFAEQEMLWLLIKAVRDYIARMERAAGSRPPQHTRARSG